MHQSTATQRTQAVQAAQTNSVQPSAQTMHQMDQTTDHALLSQQTGRETACIAWTSARPRVLGRSCAATHALGTRRWAKPPNIGSQHAGRKNFTGVNTPWRLATWQAIPRVGRKPLGANCVRWAQPKRPGPCCTGSRTQQLQPTQRAPKNDLCACCGTAAHNDFFISGI